MKKILSLFLALMMLCVLSVPALAANETSGTTALSYRVTASYTITIPTSITVTNGVGSDTYKVNAGSLLEGGKKLTFTITGATNYDSTGNKFRMVNSTDSSVYLGYTITKPDGADTDELADSVVKDTAFLEVLATEAYTGKDVTLTYTTDTATVAGNYSDTVTITVATVNVT